MSLFRRRAWVFASVVALAGCGSDSDDNPTNGTGGAANGGSSSGGGTATGGSVSGGAGGGPSTGGASTGGTAAGGTSSTGGVATGGTLSTGGTATGGASTGGASTGGAGGAATGGTSSGGAAATGGGSSSDPLTLTSSVVKDGEQLPAKYRCKVPSIPIAWSGGPVAKSYAVILRDVTPGVSNGFLHWVIYDLPPDTKALPEGVPVGYAVASPAGAHQAPIYNGTVGFNGPCGGMNTYEMTLYALDAATLTDLSMSSTGAQAKTAIEAHDLATTKITIKSQP